MNSVMNFMRTHGKELALCLFLGAILVLSGCSFRSTKLTWDSGAVRKDFQRLLVKYDEMIKASNKSKEDAQGSIHSEIFHAEGDLFKFFAEFLTMVYEHCKTFSKERSAVGDAIRVSCAQDLLAEIFVNQNLRSGLETAFDAIFAQPQPDFQVRSTLTLAFALDSIKKEISNDIQRNRVGNEFLNAFTQTLLAYQRNEPWAGYTPKLLTVYTYPALTKDTKATADAAMHWIAYVRLATAKDGPWQILAVPEVHKTWLFGAEEFHVQLKARKEFKLSQGSPVTFTGNFEMQSRLTDDDLQIHTGETTIRAAFSIDSEDRVRNVKSTLDLQKRNEPAYVLYIDDARSIQGFCSGPTCSQEILNQIAKDLFGAEIGVKLF
ncbi:hypothetical protein HY230_00040 [Candidatus Acetothermia bacterium]|nr:hypothetical protein [Candidatus Acetothermia bacterium]